MGNPIPEAANFAEMDSTLDGDAPTTGSLAVALRVVVAAGLSGIGDWLTTVALVTVLYQATGSAVGPAGYMLVRVAPRILGAAPGGHLADHYSAKFVAVGTLILQGLATTGLLLVLGGGSLPPIYIAIAVAQLFGAVARPLFPALVGIYAPADQRGTVNSLDQAVSASTVVIGPAIGAALLAVTGATTLLAIDVATFVLAALLLLTLPRTPRGGVGHNRLGEGAADGFRLLWREAPLRVAAAGLAASGAAVTAVQAILVVAASDRFGGADHVGYCYSAVGLGGIIGALLAFRLRRRAITSLDLYATFLCEIAALTLLTLSPSLWPALVLLTISSLGGTLSYTFSMTVMQNVTPPALLGRVSAALVTANFIGMLAGAVVALLLATVLGWAVLVLSFSVACIILLTGTALISRPAAPMRVEQS